MHLRLHAIPQLRTDLLQPGQLVSLHPQRAHETSAAELIAWPLRSAQVLKLVGDMPFMQHPRDNLRHQDTPMPTTTADHHTTSRKSISLPLKGQAQELLQMPHHTPPGRASSRAHQEVPRVGTHMPTQVSMRSTVMQVKGANGKQLKLLQLRVVPCQAIAQHSPLSITLQIEALVPLISCMRRAVALPIHQFKVINANAVNYKGRHSGRRKYYTRE
eukprot:4870157-Amphidinium_carterae.2